jgi:hypothetical protein
MGRLLYTLSASDSPHKNAASGWLSARLFGACATGLYVAVLCASCATSEQAHSSEADLHRAFARIQSEEARIAEAERRWDEDSQCASRCRWSEQACDAAREICAIADSHPDPDALARCRSGERVCTQERAELVACDCAKARNAEDANNATPAP